VFVKSLCGTRNNINSLCVMQPGFTITLESALRVVYRPAYSGSRDSDTISSILYLASLAFLLLQ
jgi:hypothetical protein